ncbi:MAG: hypothetical protein RLY20_1392 [Verrucomicrobiota bacterium]|jgi:hypothetical protein
MNFVLLFVVLLSVSVGGYAKEIDNSLGAVRVLKCDGKVEASPDGVSWSPVVSDAQLVEGTLLRTAAASTADLLLQYNGSVFRLSQQSELRVEKLNRLDTGLGMVTETRLNVQHGTLVGSQRKLQKPSILEIDTPVGKAFIRGTEYIVNSAGAVSVLSGSVEVTYNLPGNKGSVKVTVNAGYTFDPKTQTVVSTTSAYLQNLIADINTVKNNAETFKAGGATVVIKPSDTVSPTAPHGNNGVGNGVDPQPPGNPPVNDGPGTGPGNPGRGNGP